MAPCTVLLARKCSLLLGLRVTGLRSVVKSQSPRRPGNRRPEACVSPAGRLQVRAGLGFHTRGLCSFSPVRRGGGSARSCRSAPTTHTCPRAAGPQKARASSPKGKRGHERWGGRKGAWTVKAVQERSLPSWSQAHPAWAFVVRRMSQGSPRGGTSRSLDPSIHTHVKRFITGTWPAW